MADGWEVDALVRQPGAALLDGVTPHVVTGDAEALADLVGARPPSVCFHLATHFRAVHTTADVGPLVAANVGFATALAEAVSRARSPAITPIFVNTGTVWQHFEGAAYDPVSLYAATKQAFVDVLTYFTRVEGLTTTTVELSDTYGPHDTRGKLIPTLVDAARTGRRIELSGGDQLVDPLHVDDAVDALLAAAAGARSDAGRTWTASSGAPVTITRLVEMIGEALGSQVDAHFGARPRRPREMLEPWAGAPPPPGWRPRIDLATGLRRLAATD